MKDLKLARQTLQLDSLRRIGGKAFEKWVIDNEKPFYRGNEQLQAFMAGWNACLIDQNSTLYSMGNIAMKLHGEELKTMFKAMDIIKTRGWDYEI